MVSRYIDSFGRIVDYGEYCEDLDDRPEPRSGLERPTREQLKEYAARLGDGSFEAAELGNRKGDLCTDLGPVDPEAAYELQRQMQEETAALIMAGLEGSETED